jgi:hypothetical protein
MSPLEKLGVTLILLLSQLMQLLMERGADIQYAVPQLDSRINIECENCHRQITAEFNSLHSYQVRWPRNDDLGGDEHVFLAFLTVNATDGCN